MTKVVHTDAAILATFDDMGQLPKQFPVPQSVVVSPLAGQQLIIHCHGPPILGGLIACG